MKEHRQSSNLGEGLRVSFFKKNCFLRIFAQDTVFMTDMKGGALGHATCALVEDLDFPRNSPRPRGAAVGDATFGD